MADESKALVEIQEPGIAALSVRQITAQVTLIQDVMRAVMKEGEHYGIIPGTKKPSLLKAGAEKLCLTFRFAAEYESTASTTLREDFILHDIRCRLIHIPTGQVVGTGMGSCSSREEKYRWRQAKRICPACGKETIIKGKQEFGGGWICFKKSGGCGAKYKDGDPDVEGQEVGKVPNENIWDQNNTIEKMACKRAMVFAVLSATAASDIFTQDMEDAAQAEKEPEKADKTPEAPANPAPATQVPEPTPTKGLSTWASNNGYAWPHVLNKLKGMGFSLDALTQEQANLVAKGLKASHPGGDRARGKNAPKPEPQGNTEDQAIEQARNLEFDLSQKDMDMPRVLGVLHKHSYFDGDESASRAIDEAKSRDDQIDVARTMAAAILEAEGAKATA